MEFDATEGTWISVDVHPDGRRIVFDLLGDLYVLSIDGGDAELVSGGIPWEIQPRFSPDGSRILFTSDRGGGDNLWLMSPDGTNRRALTDEAFRLLNNGAWHPSGDYVVAKKHFTSERSMGAGEMWMYHVLDGGGGVQLTERKNDQMDAGEPAFSPDGRFLYWSEDMSPGGVFTYNKDPNATIYQIRRLELDTGEVRTIVNLPGGSVRPQPSPDGSSLAFVKRDRTRTLLCVQDLESGVSRVLWDGLDEDQQETWSLFGVSPCFSWTPDGREIVLSARGKIWRVNVQTGERTPVPFRVRVQQTVADALRFPQDVGREAFDVRVIRWPEPRGSAAWFQALGDLYVKRGDAAPRPLLKAANELRFAPSLSANGEQVVFVTWNDREGGRVRRCSATGGGARTLVERPGHYVSARFSRDGRWVVYHRGTGDRYRGQRWEEDPGIWIVGADGGEPRFLTREGRSPRFDRTGERVYVVAREGEKSALVSVNLLGSDRRVHAVSEHAVDFVLSPDERFLAFEELWNTYATPFHVQAKTVDVGPKMKALPVRRLSKDGGAYLSWSPDSRFVSWSLGPELFTVAVDSLFVEKPVEDEGAEAAGGGAGDAKDGGEADGEHEKEKKEKKDEKDDEPTPEPTVLALGWSEAADDPATDVYLVGGTILPMHEMTAIDDGVIHVKGNRIAAVGTRGEVAVPAGANVRDVSGKVVLPGLVDIHSHTGSSGGGVFAQQKWAFLANLAFGVTTTHDPSNNTQMIFAESEMQKAGRSLAPRVFSTGTILYGAEGDFKTVIDSYEDALSAVKRTAAWGAFSVKSYNQPRRNQRQMVIRAGRELGVMVVPEGGSTLQHNLNMLIDGHTTIEHSLPVAPLYDPELRLLSRFGTGLTPTLVVGYGGIWGENYWYETTNVWEDERLLRFVPRSVVDPRARRRTAAPEEEYHHFALAGTAAEIVRRGGNVQLGAHGQMQGLGSHWELWMFEQGGMTPWEALRAATWMGARAIGLDHELGSLQTGLLADLIVIDGDPRENVRLSREIDLVMLGGRLYDAATLEQLEPERKPLPPGPYLESVVEGAAVGCLHH